MDKEIEKRTNNEIRIMGKAIAEVLCDDVATDKLQASTVIELEGILTVLENGILKKIGRKIEE